VGKMAVAIDLTEEERRELQGWRRGGGLRKDWLSGRGLSSWQRKGWRTMCRSLNLI
jgi:hypothetical protein